jgi:hypothetical protein
MNGPNEIPANSADLWVPATICGQHRKCKGRWRTICRRAVRARSWDVALEGVERVPVDQTPGEFILQGPNPSVRGENTLLYLVGRELFDAASEEWQKDPKKNHLWFYETIRDMLVLGQAQFWFCLSELWGAAPLPMNDREYIERRAYTRILLGSVLRWWPAIAPRSGRIRIWLHDRPPDWHRPALAIRIGAGNGAWGLRLSIPDESSMDEAGALLRERLPQWDKRHPRHLALARKIMKQAGRTDVL